MAAENEALPWQDQTNILTKKCVILNYLLYCIFLSNKSEINVQKH